MIQNPSLPIIIIGTGLAGYTLAKEIRKVDTSCPLVLITHDEGHFYSKPQLSTAVFQSKSPQNLIITPLHDMQAQLNATIYAFSRVESIDIGAQTLLVQTSCGEMSLSYAKLIFACGAIPKPFALLDQITHAYRINSLHDYEHFIQSTNPTQSLTIVGSGLVGCEFAHDFTKRFSKIQVITPDPYPLYNLVPAPVGEALQENLAKLGIVWHTQSQLISLENLSDKLCLQLSSQKMITSDILLCAIGLAPNIQLAKESKLKTNEGIVVDNALQTSAPNIFALGDCAEISGLCRQYVAPILHCARALSQTLCHVPTPVSIPSMPIALKVGSYPVITFPPAKDLKGDWTIEKDQDNIKALFHDEDDILRGYALTGSFLEERQRCLQSIGKKTPELIS